MHNKYFLLTYWHRLALFNSNTLNLIMLIWIWWLMKCCIRCIGQRVCNAVVWIAELAHVEKSWKLVYFI